MYTVKVQNRNCIAEFAPEFLFILLKIFIYITYAIVCRKICKKKEVTYYEIYKIFCKLRN